MLQKRLVPAVVLEEQQDGRFNVIDGKQRIASLLSFYRGERQGVAWKQAVSSQPPPPFPHTPTPCFQHYAKGGG